MDVRDIMVPKIITVFGEDSVKDAAKIMAEHDIGSLAVIDNVGSIVGIVTERDFVKKVLKAGKHPETTLVEDIMSTKLITVDGNADLETASRIMEEHNIRRLLVTIRGEIKGIITNRLLLRHIRYRLAQDLIDHSGDYEDKRAYLLREI